LVRDVPFPSPDHHDLHFEDFRVQVKLSLTYVLALKVIKKNAFRLCFWVTLNSRKNLERKVLAERQLAMRNLQKDTNFDILIFTQHWPATVCSQWMESNKAHECVLPKVRNSWTVHGIWPTKYHTIGESLSRIAETIPQR
jgi:ribonuclease I